MDELWHNSLAYLKYNGDLDHAFVFPDLRQFEEYSLDGIISMLQQCGYQHCRDAM